MSELDDDKDIQAAEYVLGTLDADGRNNVLMQMSIDPAFAERVAYWEKRLGELHALVDQVEPPESSWDWIKARIALAPASGQVWLPGLEESARGTMAQERGAPPPSPPPLPVTPAILGPKAGAVTDRPLTPAGNSRAQDFNVVELRRSAGAWRRIALGASALAATLATFGIFRELRPDLMPGALAPREKIVERIVEKEVVRTVEVPSQRVAEFVAVFQPGDGPAPSFVMTVDIDKKTVSLRRVGATDLPDNSHELWIVTPQAPRPRSLGLVSENEFTVRRALADYDAPTLANATFGISLEPRGGSPTGQPTGPVIHGRLIQTTPSAFPGATP